MNLGLLRQIIVAKVAETARTVVEADAYFSSRDEFALRARGEGEPPKKTLCGAGDSAVSAVGAQK